jgi:Uncharacterized protein conserved in bacteria (DUF2125)
MTLPPEPPYTPKSVEIIPPGQERGFEDGPIPFIPPPRKPGRVLAVAIALLVLLIVGVLGLGWWIVGNQVNDQIDAFAAQLAKSGGKLEAASRSRAGFPFRPTVVLTKASISFPPGAPGPWGWNGEKASVGVSLFSPASIDIDVSGSGQLSISPFGEAVDLAVDSKLAALKFYRDSINRHAAARITNLSIATPDGGVVDVGMIRLDLIVANSMPTNENQPAYGMSLQLSNLTLPPDYGTPLGRTLEQLSMEGHVLGPLKQTFDEDAFTKWRDTGGTVQVPRLIAKFGPLNIALDATFALDKRMQPMGAGTGHIQGYAPALDALVATQAIRLNDANTVKSFISLLARPPRPGAEPELTLPLTVQDDKLSVGPVTVMTMPHLVWPSQKYAIPEPLPPREEPKPRRSAPDDNDTVTPAPYPRVDMPDGR